MNGENNDTNLTWKQERFCQEYIIDGNATRAAKTAGYSEDTAKEIGYENLTKPYLLARIAELESDRMARTRITQDSVVLGLLENAQRASQAVPVLNSKGGPTGEYRYEATAVNRAYELIGKAQGMFVDRKEITGADGGPIQTESVGGYKDKDLLDAMLAIADAAPETVDGAGGVEESDLDTEIEAADDGASQ